MPVKQRVTEEVSMIVDPCDYYGQDVEVEVICTMLASPYGMQKLYNFCDNYSNLFADIVKQPIVKTLISIYKENGRTYSECVNKKAFTRIFAKKINELVKAQDDRDVIFTCFDEYIEKTTDDEFHYTSPDDIDLLYAVLPDYLQLVSNRKLVSDVTSVDNNQVVPVEYNQGIQKALSEYRVVSANESKLVLPNTKNGAKCWRQNKKDKILYKLPSSMGAFAQAINPLFHKKSFVSILAPEKTGKTWLLQELAMRACKRGSGVLFIAAGDMTADEMTERMAIRKTSRNSDSTYCNELYVPVLDCKRNQNGTCTLNKRTNNVPLELEEQNSKKASKVHADRKNKQNNNQKRNPCELMQQNSNYTPCSECARCDNRAWIPAYWWVKQNPTVSLLEMSDDDYDVLLDEKNKQWEKGDFCIVDFPTNTLTISAIKEEILKRRREGHKIDMVVLDYMDILAPEKHYSCDYRQMQNQLWLDARSLAISEDVFLLTATQANRISDEVEYLTKSNISEDIRKCAHVTAMIGMMRTPADKRMGIAKMNIIAGRNIRYSEDEVYTVLQCLEQGNPFITSYLPKYFSNND